MLFFCLWNLLTNFLQGLCSALLLIFSESIKVKDIYINKETHFKGNKGSFNVLETALCEKLTEELLSKGILLLDGRRGGDRPTSSSAQ